MSSNILEITHHSGKKRWLNIGMGQWESVDVNDVGQAVITMRSGTQHVTAEPVEDILVALGYEPAPKQIPMIEKVES